MEFYKTFYVPQNAILSIAGDIDYDEAEELVKKYFADIDRGERPILRPDAVEPPQTAEVRDTVYDNISLPLVLHAYHVPEMTSNDSYALQMLTTLLSGGESARLRKELVDTKQLARFTGTFPLSTEDPGLFIAYALSNVGVEISALEIGLIEELEKVKTEPIGEREFQKLRNQVENNFISGNSSVRGIAASLAEYYAYYNDADLINTELDKYMAVTPDDIKRVANDYLKEENRVVLYYLPKAQ
jgi:predicted Zn-dependent peptidase